MVLDDLLCARHGAGGWGYKTNRSQPLPVGCHMEENKIRCKVVAGSLGNGGRDFVVMGM